MVRADGPVAEDDRSGGVCAAAAAVGVVRARLRHSYVAIHVRA